MQFADDQAASRTVSSDGTVITKCDKCRAIYAERTPPGIPPCETCWVEPMEENKDALRIFLLVRYQLIMGLNGPTDINHLAIDSAMEREGIEDRECFNKVLFLGHWWIEQIRKKD